MALEGLLAKLGPTLVREVSPHLVQLVAGFGERFRKDTSDIKAAVDTELASVARAHAGLTTSLDAQRDRLLELQEQVTVLDRKLEILQRTVEVSARQAAIDTAAAAQPQQVTRTVAICAAVFAALAFLAAVAQLVLHH